MSGPAMLLAYGSHFSIFPRLSRQSKDQNKKGPGIKLGQQGEKKGSTILPDPRKDNPMDNAKVCVGRFQCYVLNPDSGEL